MKKKEKQELHTKTEEELLSLVRQARQELFKILLEKSQKKLKNTSVILHKKKEIARLLTILNEKELFGKKGEATK